MSAKDDNRLGRWSRLKRQRARGEAVAEPETPDNAAAVAEDAPAARRGAAAPVAGKPYLPPLADPDLPPPANALVAARTEADADRETDDAAAEEDDVRELTEEEAAYLETLPPVEELTAESDFAAFLDKRVPEFIRRRALRKLWLSDPAFGFLDGMNDYDDDYSALAELAAGATAYRPDQGGYAWRDKPEDADEEAPEEGADNEGETVGASDADQVAGDSHEESMADKAKRVQNTGGRDVRARTYTANPYYQAPGQRGPVSDAEARAETADGDDDDLGDAEDDFA